MAWGLLGPLGPLGPWGGPGVQGHLYYLLFFNVLEMAIKTIPSGPLAPLDQFFCLSYRIAVPVICLVHGLRSCKRSELQMTDVTHECCVYTFMIQIVDPPTVEQF